METNLSPSIQLGLLSELPASESEPLGVFFLDTATNDLYVNELIGWTIVGCGTVPVDAIYYVNSATGNDSNPGTPASPLATLQEGARRMSKSSYRRYGVLYATGTFILDDFHLPQGIAGSRPPQIIGTLVDSGFGTLTVSAYLPGSFSPYNPAGVAVAAPTFAPDAQVGMILRMTTGAYAKSRAWIATNTPLDLTFTTAFEVVPSPGDQFVLEQPATILRFTGVNATLQFCDTSGFTVLRNVVVQIDNFVALYLGKTAVDGVRFERTAGANSTGLVIGSSSQMVSGFVPGLTNDTSDSLDFMSEVGAYFKALTPPDGSYFSADIGGSLTGRNYLFIDSNYDFAGSAAIAMIGGYFRGASPITTSHGSNTSACGNLGLSKFIGIPSTAIDLTNCSLRLYSMSISSCAGDAISCSGSNSSLSSISGTGNTGLGVRLIRNSLVQSDAAMSVTGAAGDQQVGDNAVGTWADIATGLTAKVSDFAAPSTKGCRLGA